MERIVVKVKANRKLNLGKQPNGELVNFAEGEVKIVELNDTIQFFIDNKALELLEGDEKESKKLSEIEKFIKLKYIGAELGQVLVDRFKTYDNFIKTVTMDDIIKLPGIGRDRGKEVYQEILGLREKKSSPKTIGRRRGK